MAISRKNCTFLTGTAARMDYELKVQEVLDPKWLEAYAETALLGGAVRMFMDNDGEVQVERIKRDEFYRIEPHDG